MEQTAPSPAEELNPVLSRVDALFSGDPPLPIIEAGPVLRRLRWLLALAIPLDLLGPLCWTSVPGAALTLWAWLLADGEVARAEEGNYAPADASKLRTLHNFAGVALGLVALSLFAQLVLLGSDFYKQIIATAIGIWAQR